MSPVQLPEGNREGADSPHEITIAALFTQQAARTPDAVALIAGDRELTYRELEAQSNRLARHLQKLGVEPDTLVGVALGRSETLVISLLAILKAGGAYVPLDPGYPRERLSWVIEDSKMQVLLTCTETRERIPLGRGPLTIVEVDDPGLDIHGSQAVHARSLGHNLAYVIYTSGSTGKPKGVMVENRNVANFFTGMDRVIGCEQGVWLAVTSICFDISVLELLWTLTRGFKVVLHEDDGVDAIADEISRHHVTHLQMTPSLARMLTLDARAFAALGSLRHLLLGGESVPASLIHLLRNVVKGEIHNMYGPTETTVWSTTCRVEAVGNTVPIGRPIANTGIYLLDGNFNPVPAGDVGELFIGGDGVARGYWNRPDLTAERFIRVPSLSQQRLYRTGDLARYQPDGNLEFLGRTDYQIKLRGHRIEPGEIEAALEQSAGVRQAVVVMREDREGDQRLVAYLVAERAGDKADMALRREMESKMPDYMVPSSFVFLPAFPLTDNGKIDRKALLDLPQPGLVAGPPEAPQNNGAISDLELTVARAWAEALAVPSVGIHDNFFDLGAHSLTVVEVHARLQQELGRDIALIDLFQFTTVSALASHLAGSQPRGQLLDRAQRRRLARQR